MSESLEAVAARWQETFDAALVAAQRLNPFPPNDDRWGAMASKWVPGGLFPGADPGLLALAGQDESWLDIGAGAGRISADLSPRVRSIVACDPSPGMTAALRETAASVPAGNIQVLDPTPWPPVIDVPKCDVALACMVIFFVRDIVPFIDAMEAHASSRCIVMASTYPGGKPHDFDLWRSVHGEDYLPGPAADDFLAVLAARGTTAEVTSLGAIQAHGAAPMSVDEAFELHHHRYFVAPGTVKERQFRDGLRERHGNPDGTVGPIPWGNEAFIVGWNSG